MRRRDQNTRRSGSSLKRHLDHRSPYERDLARLIHSAAFRRLQAKTQVLGIGEGDFHRTRLTHSMEVAQIGRGLVRNLKSRSDIKEKYKRVLPESGDLILLIGLAHDLGHPPFGHGGEVALNCSMKDHGGFEGNGQTLRILSKLEAHTKEYGLDFSRRSLLGILKYPAAYSDVVQKKLPKKVESTKIKSSDWKPPKCYLDSEQDVVDWILSPLSSTDRTKFMTLKKSPTNVEHGKPECKSLDTSIMDLADDVAYGVHDLEDSIALKLFSEELWDDVKKYSLDKIWAKKNKLSGIGIKLFSNDSSDRKRAVGAIVHALMVNAKIEEKDFSDPLLGYQVYLCEEARVFINKLKNTISEHVIKAPEVQTLEYRGQQIVLHLFDALSSDPERLLKKSFAMAWAKAPSKDEQMRVICDYIAGMTDDYATRLYERLFVPRHGTVFQRL